MAVLILIFISYRKFKLLVKAKQEFYFSCTCYAMLKKNINRSGYVE